MMTLTKLAQVLGGQLVGHDATFTGVSTDTRAIAANDLFVALTGTRYDGHKFLVEAHTRGAVGALVAHADAAPLPVVRVANTQLAFGRLAAHWRAQFKIPVIAVTGSNGKTTVKEMLAAILARRGQVMATRGNLNNEIGVPLTLVRLRANDKFAVVEMGMNHLGEIGYLSGLARPTIALITNAQQAHLAGVGTVDDVARAKGEIYQGLSPDGVAVINADDPRADYWRGLAAPRRCVTFGLTNAADVSAEYRGDAEGSTLRSRPPHGTVDLRVPLLGRHNALNALAAAACALVAGATLTEVQIGLATLRPVAGRLEPKVGANGARVIDDTYNANPDSLAAGLATLADISGERVLVLGDMAELGDTAAFSHRHAGEQALALGVERLYAVGEFAARAVESFGAGAHHFSDVDALIKTLRSELHDRMIVLVKGSRVMRMERVVEGITGAPSQVTAGHEVT